MVLDAKEAPPDRVVLAVDFGGTKTALALVDARGRLRDRRVIAAAHSVEESVEQIAASAAGASAVGIIVPGIYSRETGRAWCPNLWGPDEVPLRGALKDRLPVDAVIDSDRSGYVLGESWMGAARGLRHAVFVAIGTGIGVGILSNGIVVRGASGIAGAAGWLALDPRWNEAYGATGCWEAEAAGPGIARAAGLPDARAVVAAARSGEPAALQAIDRAASYCAMGVANLISLFNPEVVVLGGGLMVGAGDLYLPRIRFAVGRWAQPIAASRCRIELTQLGDDAGLFGAARLALDGA